MQSNLARYQVKHPLLKKYVRFFWEIHIENMLLNHKILPQRNINLRFNLNDTPHYLCSDGREHLLEDIYFQGLQDRFRNIHLKLNGRVDVLGVCFFPDGFYPFIKIPVSECRNQVLGSKEVGFKLAESLSERLKTAQDVSSRLELLENELVKLLIRNANTPETFREIFNTFKQSENSLQISEFCRRNNIGLRKLERMFDIHVGLSANTYGTLNRFHRSLNQILYQDYSKLSDVAYCNGYFDQMHFIKEFKRFAGNTPKKFVRQKNSILQIGNPG